MPKKLNYVSTDTIMSKLYRDLGLEEISERDVVEMIGEALEFISVASVYEEAIAFVEVVDHQIDIPNGLHSIIQIARNNSWSASNKISCTPANVLLDTVTEEIPNITEPCSNCPVPLDCNGEPITGYDVAYYRPYFDLQYEYSGWTVSNYYKQTYTPVRLSNHVFFNTLVCEEDTIYASDLDDEYTIVEDKIRFSFKEGSVAIAYYRQKIDENTGYPMIPDDISAITAITYYITWKYMQRLWYSGREGYSDKMQQAEKQWVWYVKQFQNSRKMPYGVDEFQNLLEGSQHLIPKTNRYYGFFGKIGKREQTTFKDPNRRSLTFRGIL